MGVRFSRACLSKVDGRPPRARRASHALPAYGRSSLVRGGLSGYHPSYSQPTDHPTQSRRGTPVSPSAFCECGCFSQVRPADTPREAAASACTCGALLEMPNVLGSAGSWSFVMSNRWGCGGLARSARRLHFFSSLAASSFTSLHKLLRRHHRARARGAARRHAMGGFYRDRYRGSDRDRRPADHEESSDLRRRSGGAARCSAV